MDAAERRVDRDELLGRTDLAELLDALTTGTGCGRRRTWRCPERDHPDAHPSVTVRTDARGVERWKCWSGGHGGTAIDAVVAARGLRVGDAMRWLAENFAHLEPVPRLPAPPARPVGEPAPEVVEYVERCAKLLWSGSGRPIREWLNARGYTDDVLAVNKVGADPGRRFLPRPRGFPGGWPAAVYPALDVEERVAYFQARYLNPPDGRGKYDNPSRRWASNPRLGWTRPPDATRRRPSDSLVVVEGIADALAANSLGFEAVGVLGAGALDDAGVGSIAQRSTSRQIVICFDPDDSGDRGAASISERIQRLRTMKVEIVRPPDGLDLTTWATTEPKQAAISLVPGAQFTAILARPAATHPALEISRSL
ncbi:MAG: toprim domain-containing protein [Ilumatobacter sp.]